MGALAVLKMSTIVLTMRTEADKEENMTTSAVDLSDLLKDIPAGAWVAISESKQVAMAYGPDAQEVLRKAKERGEERPLILRVPERATALFF
jgi:hypothetical protein